MYVCLLCELPVDRVRSAVDSARPATPCLNDTRSDASATADGVSFVRGYSYYNNVDVNQPRYYCRVRSGLRAGLLTHR